MNKIIRKKRINNFTIINNTILKENHLSLPAIGLLVFTLSKPDNWSIYPKYLEKVLTKKDNSKAGYRYILEIINELEEKGYVSKHRNYDGTMDYIVFDEPNADFPHEEKPHEENPHTKQELTLKQELTKKEEMTKSLFSFKDWYKLYPKKVKKLRAEKLFKKLTKKELDILIPATKLYITYKQDNGEYFQNPDTFLNQKVFLDLADDIQQQTKESQKTDEIHTIATTLAKKFEANEGASFSQFEIFILEDSKATINYAQEVGIQEFTNFLKPYIQDRQC